MITKAEIKAEAFNRTVQDYHLQDSFITTAQEKHLRPVLGDDLYDDVVANESNHTALLALIKPVLAWFVKYYALPSIAMDISTTGIKKINTETTSTQGQDELGTLQQQALNMANTHVDIMTKYLIDNNYPLYRRSPGTRIEIAGGIIFNK